MKISETGCSGFCIIKIYLLGGIKVSDKTDARSMLLNDTSLKLMAKLSIPAIIGKEDWN